MRIAGISSFHPFFPTQHYPLIDIDKKIPREMIIKWLHEQSKKLNCEISFTLEKTPHGWHVYVWKPMPIKKCYTFMSGCPFADLVWIRVGLKRKHWFLRTTQVFDVPVPVTYMAIEGGQWYGNKKDL